MAARAARLQHEAFIRQVRRQDRACDVAAWVIVLAVAAAIAGGVWWMASQPAQPDGPEPYHGLACPTYVPGDEC